LSTQKIKTEAKPNLERTGWLVDIEFFILRLAQPQFSLFLQLAEVVVYVVGGSGPEVFRSLLVDHTHHVHRLPALTGSLDEELQDLLLALVAMAYVVLNLAKWFLNNIAMARKDSLRLDVQYLLQALHVLKQVFENSGALAQDAVPAEECALVHGQHDVVGGVTWRVHHPNTSSLGSEFLVVGQWMKFDLRRDLGAHVLSIRAPELKDPAILVGQFGAQDALDTADMVVVPVGQQNGVDGGLFLLQYVSQVLNVLRHVLVAGVD